VPKVEEKPCYHGTVKSKAKKIKKEGGRVGGIEKAEWLKENSVKVSAPTLHSSMVCETVENGKLKRLVCKAEDSTEESGERERRREE